MAPLGTAPGKLVVLTTTGCGYCKRAKAALRDASIAFDEVDISGKAELRTAIKSETGKSSVPQIFSGGTLLGGCDEVLAALADGTLTKESAAAAGPGLPESIATLLAEAKASVGPTSAAAWAPPGTDAQRYAELRSAAAVLAERLPRKPLARTGLPWARRFDVSSASFTGASAAAWAASERLLGVGQPAEAAALLGELLGARLLTAVRGGDGTFRADENASYVLASDARAALKLGDELNGHISWTGEARPAGEVASSLRGMILDLYDKYLAADGKGVDYAGMAADPAFALYVDATAELQAVDASAMEPSERSAFLINVYNALVVHALAAFGSATSVLARPGFFGRVAYRVGGMRLSCDDIEHGLLRDNAVAPASIGALLGIQKLAKRQLKEGDPRLALRVPLDPRLHFALVCGAKSCPPIKLYTPENLDIGLQEAAESFCESEIEVIPAQRCVRMSKIFKWYGADFAAGSKDTGSQLRGIAEYCPPARREQLLALLESGTPKVEFKPYDWDPNSKS